MYDDKGQAVIELALVIPILLVLAFGIIDFGRMMYTKNALVHAARSAARVATVTSPLRATSPALLTSATGEPAGTINSALTGIDKNRVTYEVRIVDSGTGSALSGPAVAGNRVTVKLTLAGFQILTPIYRLLTVQDTGPTLSGEASMRYE